MITIIVNYKKKIRQLYQLVKYLQYYISKKKF